jgi:drug/metabolite transporter (DMT)-like permease
VTGLAVGLALLASVLFAFATAVQHRAAVEVPHEQARGLRLLRRLLRSRRWWTGVLLAGFGYAAHAAALGIGSLLLVQPLLVTVLLFALPLSARLGGRRLTRSDWSWAGVLAVALAGFLVLGRPTAGVDRAPLRNWAWALIVMGIVVVVCLGAAAVRRGTSRALLLAAATGVLFGAGAALTKGTVTLLPLGLGPLVQHWELYGLVVVMAVGGLTEQSAFQAGHLQASLPAVTVGEPVIAALLGATVLRESLAASGRERVLIALLVVVMVAATIALARAAARLEPDPPVPEPVTGPDASRSPRS